MFKLNSGRSSKYKQVTQKRSNDDPLGAKLDIGSYFAGALLGLAIYYLRSFTNFDGSLFLGFGIVFIFKGVITIIRRRYYSYEYIGNPEVRSEGKGAIWWGIFWLIMGIALFSLGLFFPQIKIE